MIRHTFNGQRVRDLGEVQRFLRGARSRATLYNDTNNGRLRLAGGPGGRWVTESELVNYCARLGIDYRALVEADEREETDRWVTGVWARIDFQMENAERESAEAADEVSRAMDRFIVEMLDEAPDDRARAALRSLTSQLQEGRERRARKRAALALEQTQQINELAGKRDAPTRHERTVRVEIDHEAIRTRAMAGNDEGLIPIALSSEHPVERYDAWEGERYMEILDHSPGAIDMSRAERGLPFLDSHNSRDGRAQMGRIVNLRIQGGKLHGAIKFSARQEAQDYKRDMLEGIRTDISVGYQIDPSHLEISQATGQLKTVRVKRWTPLEASGVAVPADPTVGVGRNK